MTESPESVAAPSTGGIWNTGGTDADDEAEPIRRRRSLEERAKKPAYKPRYDDETLKTITLNVGDQGFKDLMAHEKRLLADIIPLGSIKFDVELERVRVDHDDHKDLLVHVFCHRDGLDPHWRCTFEVETTLTVITKAGDSVIGATSAQKADARYKDNSVTMPMLRLPATDSIAGCTLVVKLKISNWKGFHPRLVHDFTKRHEFTNATLIVEGQPLYVDRATVSIHSAFFNNLFFNENFSDSYKEEYIIHDVSYDDMLLFLSLCYPETMVGKRETFVTTIDDLERALHLSEQYSAGSIKTLAERLLKRNHFPDVPWTRLLYIADKFRLSEACSSQLGKLATQADYVRLSRSDEFELLTNRLRSKLLTGALEKMPKSTRKRMIKRPSRTGRLGVLSDIEIDEDEDAEEVEVLGERVVAHPPPVVTIPSSVRASKGPAGANVAASGRLGNITSADDVLRDIIMARKERADREKDEALRKILKKEIKVEDQSGPAWPQAIPPRATSVVLSDADEGDKDFSDDDDDQPGPSNRPAKRRAAIEASAVMTRQQKKKRKE